MRTLGNTDYLFADGFQFDYTDRPFLPGFGINDSIVPTAGFSSGTNSIGALESGVPGIAQAVESNSSSSLLDIVKLALGTWQLTQQQKSFLKVNEQLIAQGRTPIAWDQMAPTANVGVALDPNTRTMLYVLGAGLIAVLAAMALKRR